VAVHGSKGRSEKDGTNYDKDYRQELDEFKKAAVCLIDQENDTEGDDDGWAHQAANRAALTAAAEFVVSHSFTSFSTASEPV